MAQYPDNVFLNNLGITINNEGGYARTIQSLRMKPTGSYELSTNGDTGKNIIGISGDDSDIKVYSHDAKSRWNERELQEAALSGKNLVQLYLEAHNEAYQKKLDYIGFMGAKGSTGLLNYSGYTTTAAGKLASAMTAAEMYTAISGLINAQWAGCKNIMAYKANVVLMPDSVYNRLSTTVYSTTGDNPASVLVALQKNFAGVQFISSARAEADQLGGTSKTVAFSNNRNAMQFRLPVPLRTSNIFTRGFSFEVEGYFSVAGCDFLENTAFRGLSGL
ncbi:MAG: major capsid family protein [Deferribacterales bacterium]